MSASSAPPPDSASQSSHEVSPADAGQRLDRWLAAPERLGSRARAARAIQRGKVLVDEVEQSLAHAGRKLRAGERVRIWMDRPGTGRGVRFTPRTLGDLRVVHEDDDVLVVDKPAGLLTVPRDGHDREDTVIARLERALESARRRTLFVVHRIDRGTTGLVVVARHPGAHRVLKQQFLEREPERRYLAIVHGIPEPEHGVWEDQLLDDPRVRLQRRARSGEKGSEAISRYRVIERFARTTAHAAAGLVAVELVTGRRNQIRVQAALRAHPLVGDDLYTSARTPSSIAWPRPALHAGHLAFRHPRDGRRLVLESPLPDDLLDLLARLRNGQAPRSGERR